MISLMHVFPLSTFFYFSGFAFVLTVVALRWNFVEGLGVLLLLAWFFGVFSKMPTALIFWSLFGVFCVLKLVLESIELKRRLSVAVLFLFAALGFYILQFLFLHQVSDAARLSFLMVGRMTVASFVEGLSGFILGPAFLAWISPR